jgi:hypothetical protein
MVLACALRILVVLRLVVGLFHDKVPTRLALMRSGRGSGLRFACYPRVQVVLSILIHLLLLACPLEHQVVIRPGCVSKVPQFAFDVRSESIIEPVPSCNSLQAILLGLLRKFTDDSPSSGLEPDVVLGDTFTWSLLDVMVMSYHGLKGEDTSVGFVESLQDPF